MLKLFYKVILVSVLSGSLMLMDFSYKGFLLHSAFGDDSSKAASVSSVQAQATAGSTKETLKTDAIKDQDLMGTLTMTAVGTLASRLYSYKMTTDIMLAAAGGAIFLAGEVLAFLKLKDVMKGMETEIARTREGNLDKEQIEILEKLKQSYVEARKTAETKKTLQMAAAAAFAAAGVMSYTLAAGDMTALTTCSAGITTALGTLAGPVTATCQGLLAGRYTQPQGAQCMAAVGSCKAAITAYQAGLTKYELERQATAPSATGLATTTADGLALSAKLKSLAGACPTYASAANGSLQPTCTPLIPVNNMGSSGGVVLGTGGVVVDANSIKSLPPIYKQLLENPRIKGIINNPQYRPTKLNYYVTKLSNLIFPEANAALFSAMGIISGAAISYLMATSATLGPTIDLFMLIPQKRAIVWGVLAGLTFAATTATNNVISQIDSNISKIDAILKSLYANADGAVATQINPIKLPVGSPAMNKPINKAGINATNYENVDLTGIPNGSLPCFTGSDESKCKSFEDSVKDLPSYAGLNSDSRSQLTGILKTAEAFNGKSKIGSGSIQGASGLGGSAASLRAVMDKAKKDADEKLKKLGSKFDIDKQTIGFSKLIDDGVRASLKKVNSTPSQMMASMYGGTGGASAAGAVSSKSKEESADGKDNAVGNVIDIGSGAGAVSSNMDAGLGGMNNGQATPEEVAAYNAASKGAADINDYDIKNDITKDTGSSIFELISNRYQHSGYPRLFKAKEPQVETPVKK